MQSAVNDSLSCNCLPGCFEISYDTEISVASLLPIEGPLKNKGITAQNVSFMHIFYQTSYFRSQSKEEIVGFTEFLCKFGFALEFSFEVIFFNFFFFYFSRYRWSFGSIHGIQCVFYCRNILLFNISSVHSSHESTQKVSPSNETNS